MEFQPSKKNSAVKIQFAIEKLFAMFYNYNRIKELQMSLQFLKDEFAKLVAVNDKFGKWENELNEKLNGGKLLSLKLFQMMKRTPIDWDTLWIVTSIGTFTLNNNVENFEYVLNQAQRRGVIKNFERKKIGYSLVSKDDTLIRFIKLTDFIPSLDEDVKKRLESSKRSGHCHWDSIHLAEHLEMPSKVVSGYCTMQSKKMPYPHTWVELEHQGKEWVLDFTMNEVMNKEGYYKLYNPQNTIAIDNTTLIEDLQLRKRSSLEFEDIRMYLFHPEEARDVMQEEIKSHKTYEQGEFPWIMIEK